MPLPIYWTGPLEDRCQISGRKLGGVMYDARIPGKGQWANIDQIAFVNLGCKLGVGHGQRFELQTDGRWLCTAGSAAHEAAERKHAVTLSDEDRRQITEEAQSRKAS